HVYVRRRDCHSPAIHVDFHYPLETDPLAPALSALSDALAGATAGGGESASGRSSRLYRALIDSGLATDVDATYTLRKDPYLFVVEATLGSGSTHHQVERVILDELARMADQPLEADEFARVRRQLLSASAFMTDTITWRAYRLGEVLATGAATSLAEWYDRLAAGDAEDIRAAAESIFKERSRVVGWFIPEEAA